MTVGEELIDFLMDTGAAYSVVNTNVAQKTSQSVLVTVMGTERSQQGRQENENFKTSDSQDLEDQ